MSGVTINGTSASETWSGTGFNDIISGGGGNDSISGLDGNDTLTGASGRDTILGGDGADFINLGGSTGTNLDVGLGGAGADTIVAPFGRASIDGGDDNDSLVGSSDANTILGGAGDDTIYGGSGQDYLKGGTGNNYFDLKNEGERAFVEDSGTARIHGTYGPNAIKIDSVPGSVTVDGVTRTYDFKVTGNGFDLYFKNFSGNLVFDNTTVTAPCFAAGTMIATARGERRVEDLRVGDLVATVSGKGAWLKPVRWIGWRSIDLARHPKPESVAPIMVMPGALGPAVPSRTLRLSPDHALFLDGLLVPAGTLVDGQSIVQEPAIGTVTYFHVELDSHDLLLAEGAPAESYADHGNRADFTNAGVLARLHPEFVRREKIAAPHADCAHRIARPEEAVAIRERLAAMRERTPALRPALSISVSGR